MANMQLILLRHGTRDFGLGDVELNALGRAEAEALAQQAKISPTQRVYCSPKKRAQMTVAPLCENLGCTPMIDPQLDQQWADESIIEFRQRIQKFLNKITDQYGGADDTLLVCSHSDWLSMAVDLMDGGQLQSESLFFKCAQFHRFSFSNPEAQWTLS